ncbi:MAG TPA: glycerol-3-phosphate acyltransferase [Candidatus Dormibacteraeota bacterium]|nr:glycerol-3-phosphate acyltransferase [Candidatus Dormibacteraeota bacterium]
MVPEPLRDALLIVAGYLIGSIPMGVLVARLTGGQDPRAIGSGRTGGTNAIRAMGPVRGVTVGLLDLGKGLAAVLLATVAGAGDLALALVGIAAVSGAWRSIFLRLHGGRGVATGIGAMLGIAPLAIVLAAPIFFGAVIVTGYVSMGSLLGTASVVLITAGLVAAGIAAAPTLLYAVVSAAIIYVAHSDNIRRLLAGTERRTDFRQLTRREDPSAGPR